MHSGLKRAVDATGFGDRARKIKRAFEPASTTQDRRDHEHLGVILAAALRPDSNCIDIGAHGGDVLADMLRLAPHGRHVAFEPLPATSARRRSATSSAQPSSSMSSRVPGGAAFASVRTLATNAPSGSRSTSCASTTRWQATTPPT
jgi:hypothetical protein